MVVIHVECDIPSVPSVSERYIIHRRAHELVLGAFSCFFPEIRKTKWIEDVGMSIILVICVDSCSGGDAEGPFRNKRPIREGQVYQSLSHDRGWIIIEAVNIRPEHGMK